MVYLPYLGDILRNIFAVEAMFPRVVFLAHVSTKYFPKSMFSRQ